jgi:ferredoxin
MSTLDVNRALCQSNGVCEGLAPAVFEIDDDGVLQLNTVQIGRDQLDRVRLAVRSCPTRALSLSEE